MLKHGLKLVVLSVLCTIAPASAERLATGAAHRADCPYERAHLAAAQSEPPTGQIAGGGGWLGVDRASIFVP